MMGHDDSTTSGTLYGSEASRIAARGESLGIEMAVWDGAQRILRGFRVGNTTFRWCRPLADMLANLAPAEALRRFLERHAQPLSEWDGGGWREGQDVSLMDAAIADHDYEAADILEHDNAAADRPVGVCRSGRFVATDPEFAHQNGTPMSPPEPEPETLWSPLTPENLAAVRGH